MELTKLDGLTAEPICEADRRVLMQLGAIATFENIAQLLALAYQFGRIQGGLDGAERAIKAIKPLEARIDLLPGAKP